MQVEMIALVNGDRLAGDDTGTHATGSCPNFGPVRAHIKARRPQRVLEPPVAEEIHRHALGIGQQQHIILARYLPEQCIEPGSRDGDQPLGLFAMGAQFGFGDDMGG